MLIRTRPLAAMLFAGALMLTGCSSEEPEPKVAKEPTASATPEKEETAEEFIRRWNEADAEMQNTGDTAPYREITSSCVSCSNLADRIDEIYANGGEVSWAGRRIKTIRKTAQNTYVITAVTSPTTYRDTSGGPEKSFPGGDGTYILTVKATDSGMQIGSFAERGAQ